MVYHLNIICDHCGAEKAEIIVKEKDLPKEYPACTRCEGDYLTKKWYVVDRLVEKDRKEFLTLNDGKPFIAVKADAFIRKP